MPGKDTRAVFKLLSDISDFVKVIQIKKKRLNSPC